MEIPPQSDFDLTDWYFLIDAFTLSKMFKSDGKQRNKYNEDCNSATACMRLDRLPYFLGIKTNFFPSKTIPKI